MLLRPYQTRTVSAAKAALKKHGNTLVQAATGAGKTVILSALAQEVNGKTLIIQHREELVRQNSAKFTKINPDWDLSFFTSKDKSFAGKAVFAMHQTITNHTDDLPAFDHVIVDECHHIMAPTYARIIDACYERNKKMLLTGFTATPERGDKKTLRPYFNNVAEQVTIRELVALGFLVPPKAFVVNVGAQEQLQKLKSVSAFGDQADVAKVMDTPVINAEVVRHWQEKASNRKTIVFCATIQHALDVAHEFEQAGVRVAVITGDMPAGERKVALTRFDKGDTQVLLNVAVLTEGYDSQPVSCIVLLRQCSEKGTMVQMAGRGLRTVDPEQYPGVLKEDCIILDFGISILTHGDLDQGDGLHAEKAVGEQGEALMKVCPGCESEIPNATRECPICGYKFEGAKNDEDALESVEMTEFDLLNASPFRWLDLFGTDTCLMASGFAAWAGVFSPDQGTTWMAIGKLQDEKNVHKLAWTGRLQAMSRADDFLRANETSGAAKKSKQWLNDPATTKQIEVLGKFGYNPKPLEFTKYSAACHASFQFNRRVIERALGV